MVVFPMGRVCDPRELFGGDGFDGDEPVQCVNISYHPQDKSLLFREQASKTQR